MRKWFSGLALAAFLPVVAHAVGPQPAPLSPPVEVTFGYQKVGHLAPIVTLADELKKLGINLKLVEFVRYADARTALLARAQKRDVANLYWLAAAWGSAIANAKDDMQLVGDLPIVSALMKRALVLDEGYEEGSIHEFFITYDAAQGDGKAAAKKHFERALELSHNKKLAPYVSYAEAVCVDAQDKKEFVRLLDKVIAFDVDSDPDHRLVNILAQRRARWLMSRIADLFAE